MDKTRDHDIDVNKQGQTQVHQGQDKGIGSPISNEAFDVISALHKKLEGLEAFRKYSKDGATSLWKQLSDLDVQCVTLLCEQLEQLVRDGKLRTAGTSGTTTRPTVKS